MSTYKAWTGMEEARLKKMAEARVPAAVIAETLERSKTSIYWRAQKLGVSLAYPTGEHHPRVVVPDDVIRGLRLLHGCGISAAALARLIQPYYGTSTTYVQYVCKGERRQEVA